MLGRGLTRMPQPLPLAWLYVHGSLLSVAHYPKPIQRYYNFFILPKLCNTNLALYYVLLCGDYKKGHSAECPPIKKRND